MDANTYQRLAQRTANADALAFDHLLNGALGLAGEAGEVIDHVKKHMFQGHPLDRAALIGELGDILWYVVEAAVGLDIDLDEVMSANIEKLERRYPDGFSAERSIHRESTGSRG